jgi:hypothetical protein
MQAAQPGKANYRVSAFQSLVKSIRPLLIAPLFMCNNLSTLARGDTHLTEKRETILVASWDPRLADVRKSILEKEGFVVLQARGSAGVRDLCKKKKISLVLIGYLLPPSEKRKRTSASKQIAVSRLPLLPLPDGTELHPHC